MLNMIPQVINIVIPSNQALPPYPRCISCILENEFFKGYRPGFLIDLLSKINFHDVSIYTIDEEF